jgi:hypothetical protein
MQITGPRIRKARLPWQGYNEHSPIIIIEYGRKLLISVSLAGAA